MPGIMQAAMDKVAAVTGRQYHLFDYVGHPQVRQPPGRTCFVAGSLLLGGERGRRKSGRDASGVLTGLDGRDGTLQGIQTHCWALPRSGRPARPTRMPPQSAFPRF